MATTAALVTLTYDILGLPESGNSLLASARVVDALNRAYRQFARETQCYARPVTTALVNDQAEYTIPTDVMSIEYAAVIDSASVRHELSPLSKADLDSTYAGNSSLTGWRDADAGLPQYYYLVDARKVGLYPPPSVTDGTAVSLTYDAFILPSSESGGVALLVSGSVNPSLQDDFADALAEYAAYYLATRFLADDTAVQARGMAALERYRQLVRAQRGALVDIQGF